MQSRVLFPLSIRMINDPHFSKYSSYLAPLRWHRTWDHNIIIVILWWKEPGYRTVILSTLLIPECSSVITGRFMYCFKCESLLAATPLPRVFIVSEIKINRKNTVQCKLVSPFAFLWVGVQVYNSVEIEMHQSSLPSGNLVKLPQANVKFYGWLNCTRRHAMLNNGHLLLNLVCCLQGKCVT